RARCQRGRDPPDDRGQPPYLLRGELADMATPPPVPLPHPYGPLAGYRVLDLADEKGQLCGRLLGEMGADVFKVEPPTGDRTRTNGPFFNAESGPDSSLWWWVMNAGKRSLTCDLEQEAGRNLFRELVAA